MYCGCNPTALASQLQISEALVRLMERKGYSEITVSELCRESGISRQTFYTLFHAKENVASDGTFLCAASREQAERAVSYIGGNCRLIESDTSDHVIHTVHKEFYIEAVNSMHPGG